MKKLKVLSLLLAIVLLTGMWGCAWWASNPLSPDTANLVKGKIMEFLAAPNAGDKIGVSGTVITLSRAVKNNLGQVTVEILTDTTVGNGDFLFKTVPVGAWTLQVAKDGYHSETQSVAVTNQLNTTLMIGITSPTNDAAQGVAFINVGEIIIYKKTWTQLYGKIAPYKESVNFTMVKIIDKTNNVYTYPSMDGSFYLWVPANSAYNLDISYTGTDALGNAMKLTASKQDTSKSARRTVIDQISLTRTPTLPSNISATTGDTTGKLTVTWDEVPDDIRVKVEYRQDTGTTWLSSSTSATKSTSLSITGLNPGGKYYARVFGFNIEGYYSERSDAYSATAGQ